MQCDIVLDFEFVIKFYNFAQQILIRIDFRSMKKIKCRLIVYKYVYRFCVNVFIAYYLQRHYEIKKFVEINNIFVYEIYVNCSCVLETISTAVDKIAGHGPWDPDPVISVNIRPWHEL